MGHGLVAIVPPMQRPNGAPPRGATRLQAAMGSPIAVPLSTPNPQFWLGYEDTDYGDNGYNDHDDGTHGQCRGVSGAFVRVVISRN